MALLFEVDRRSPNGPLYPPATLRVEEAGDEFVIRRGTESVTLSEHEALLLRQTLDVRFWNRCLDCERRRVFDKHTAMDLKEHAGLFAISELDWPEIVADCGGLIETVDFVRTLALQADENDADEVRRSWGADGD